MAIKDFALFCCVIAVTVCLTAASRGSWGKVDPAKILNIQEKDKGVLTNCGGQPFSSWYFPKNMRNGDNVTVYLSITPGVGLSSGRYSVEVFLDKMKYPLIGYENSFGCKDIPPYLAHYCPLQAGKTYSGTNWFRINLDQYGIRTGTYLLRGKVWDDKGKLFVCAETKLNVRV